MTAKFFAQGPIAGRTNHAAVYTSSGYVIGPYETVEQAASYAEVLNARHREERNRRAR